MNARGLCDVPVWRAVADSATWWQPMYGSTQRGQPEHVVYVSVGGSTRKRFGENRMGQMALAALGLTMVACLVYSAATEQRHYAAYTPAVGLAQRAVKAGDITKMEMVLAAKEVGLSSSSSSSRVCNALGGLG